MVQLSLYDLHKRYVVDGRPLDAETEALLRTDSRAGAKKILELVARRRSGNRSEGQRLRKLSRFETVYGQMRKRMEAKLRGKPVKAPKAPR